MIARAIAAAAVVAFTAAANVQSQTGRTPAAGVASASVSGMVVSAENPAQPIRRAIVTLSGGGMLSRSAVTDDEGRFAIGSVQGGTYRLAITKAAYLPTTFGAAGPGRPGAPVVLRDGEVLANLRIPLMHGAAIAGTVRDFTGAPVEGLQVYAVRADRARSRRSGEYVSALDAAMTDDTGAYRVFGLEPGAYIVAAMPRSNPTGLAVLDSERIDAEFRLLGQRAGGALSTATQPAGQAASAPANLVAYAPVFHPATPNAAQAAVVTLAAGDDRRGVDILVSAVPVGAIEGQVLGMDGQPAPNVNLDATSVGPQLPNAFNLLGSPPPTADGRFRYQNVTPGTWTVTARVSARVVRRNPDGSLLSVSGNNDALPPGPFSWGAATVEVSGGTSNVSIQMRPGFAMTGRVVFDAAAPGAAVDPAQVRLSLAPDPDPVRELNAMFPNAPPAAGNPAAGGSFELKGLTPGAWQLSGIVPGGSGPNGWWLRSAEMDGHDLLDGPIEVADRDLSGVTVTFSNRHTGLGGTLAGADGKPAPGLVVVALPADRAMWTSARRIQQTKPATDGTFSFTDLPPGNYLLAAVTDVPDDGLRTEAFLTQIAPSGVPVTIGEGEHKRQDLRVTKAGDRFSTGLRRFSD